MKLILLLALLMVACVPQIPTAAAVSRVVRPTGAAPSLIGCAVTLGWTENDLYQNCGQPDESVAWAGHDGGECELYRTSAKGFGTGAGVEVVAACLTQARGRGRNNITPQRHVDAVFGLAADALPR